MEEDIPEVIVMGPDTTYSPLFWDEEGVAIGDYDLFFIVMKNIQHRQS